MVLNMLQIVSCSMSNYEVNRFKIGLTMTLFGVLALSHIHEIKRTHILLIEFDDVVPEKLVIRSYYGEGNSKGRKIEFDFEYCLGCNLRMLDGAPALTKEILQDEVEIVVNQALNGNYVANKEVTV